MGCNCGKPKCDGHCGVSPSVLQINNPSECVLFHKVEVPASMGDSITNPPKPGAYRNTLLYYKADGEAFLYSSDGIPTKITGVANDYACLENKPQINGVTLEGNKSLADIGVTNAINNALQPYTPRSELAEVAFTGDYNDLENTPPETFARFYMWPPSEGNAAPMYHDYGRTDQVTLAQFTDAIASGPVQIYMEHDGHTFWIYYVDQLDAYIPDPPMEIGTLDVSFGLRSQNQDDLGVRRFYWQEGDTAPIYDSYDPNQSDWNQTSPTRSSYIKNKPNLATVATSGSYNDLSNKPTIPAAQVNSDWNASSGVAQILNKPTLATVATSGSYNDLSDKPTIPTVNDATLTITQNGASAGTFTANASSDTTISLTDTTYSDFSGATSSAAGASGLVPAPAAGDQTKYLMGDGTWGEVQLPPSRTVLYVRTNLSYLTSPFYIYKDSSRTTPITWEEMRALLNAEDGGEVVIRVMDSSDSTYCIVSFEHDMAWFGVIDASQENDPAAIYHFHEDYDDSTRSKFVIEKQEIGGGLTELSYGNSTWSDFITAYQAGKIVYCRASSNSNPATGTQGRKAFMAYVNNAENPTEVEFQYVRSVSSKTASQPVDQVFAYKLTSANGGTWTVETRNMAPKLAAGTNATVSYSNGTYTVGATVPTKTSDLTNDGATGASVYVEESDIAPSELSGEGEFITLEGTTDCSALDTQLLGNAEQTTYSGKNLLPPTADWTQTVSGVTITCSNGQYTFSGTATANGSTTARATIAPYTIQSGDYFHYGNTLVSDQINIQIVFTDATYFATSMNATNRIVSLESYVGKTIASCRVNFASGNAFNGVVKPMILHNVSTTSDYEPYVGGIPAPNPSYPQPISTVTGEQTIQVTGKNLFNFQEFAQDKIQAGGVIRGTATATGDSITITATENDAYTRVDFAHGYPPTIRVKNNTDYVLSWKTDNTSGTNMGVVYVFARGSNNQNIIIGYRQDTAGSFQFNTGAYSEVTFRFGVATSGNSITYSNIMLEYGSQPSEYKPYDGTQSYEVNLGKNLLNINSLVKGGVTVSDGVATGQGQHFYAVFGQNTNGVSFIKRGGQLSISLKAYTDGNQAIEANDGLVVRVIYTDGTSAIVIRFLNNQTTATTKTYTTAAGKDVASIQLTYANDGGNIWHISEFQIEQGAQPTAYAPYFTPIELSKIPDTDYRDRILYDKTSGKWYIEKQVGKVVFDGTTTLTQLQASTNTTRVVATIGSEYGAPLSTVQLPLCDYFTGDSQVWSTDVQGTYIQSRYAVLRANNTIVGTTLDSFKAWLTSHPTTVYYALATPTTTEITNEALIDQLEALAGALGYDGVTNIISTSPVLPATLSVSTYTGSAIPSATRARAGIVRIGDGIDVDDCGTISVSAQKAPTVNNATLTIQKNGTTVGTFTANASSNATANITVPTKTSDVTNDSGFLTPSTLPIAGAGVLGAISVGAGLEISSSGVLSATGGGTADAVAWGHVTGTLADQTDLQTALNGKQASLSTAQLDAANSGITSAKVSTYDGYASTIARKANSADVPVIKMQTTDPGEGATLAANTFIGVYSG